MALVLVHGSGFAGSCWDLLLPHLVTPAIAVDLPGRGRRPADLARIGLDDFAAAVAEDILASGWERVVLVGHSLAGLTLPRVAALLPARIAQLVFLSSAVPAHGQTCLDTLDAATRDFVRANLAAGGGISARLDRELAIALFGSDLNSDETEWMLARMGPEAGAVLLERCDLRGLEQPIDRTWVRLLQDAAGSVEMQDSCIANIGGADVIDLDAGHMAMISRPAALAAILDGVAHRDRKLLT
jgi:pimeloyl-ACP methyl ester carboxylesterase